MGAPLPSALVTTPLSSHTMRTGSVLRFAFHPAPRSGSRRNAAQPSELLLVVVVLTSHCSRLVVPSTCARSAVPGQKVGMIAARRTGPRAGSKKEEDKVE